MIEKKKVLFIGIGFYDYEESIIKEFEKLNYEVDYFSESRPADFKSRFYSLIKKEKKVISLHQNYVLDIANSCDCNYDLVFIIKCERMTMSALELIKKKNRTAKWILYLWDSLIRISNIESKFKFFDKVYSFDRLDCLNNRNMEFLPLFYRFEYLNSNSNVGNPQYDIYHVGWCHSDRLSLIKNIIATNGDNQIKYNFLLFTTYFSYLKQVISEIKFKENKKYFIFKAISAQDNFCNIINSKATLDIAHPLQSGLTMRTIELIGMQKKVITTNQDIINYDFYHKDNIFILDRNNPKIDIAFLNKHFKPIPAEILLKYNINSWLKTIISLN